MSTIFLILLINWAVIDIYHLNEEMIDNDRRLDLFSWGNVLVFNLLVSTFGLLYVIILLILEFLRFLDRKKRFYGQKKSQRDT